MHPREGGLRRGENVWLRLLQPARSVCVSLSAFFIHTYYTLVLNNSYGAQGELRPLHSSCVYVYVCVSVIVISRMVAACEFGCCYQCS